MIRNVTLGSTASVLLALSAGSVAGQGLIDPERPYDCTLENVAGAYGFNEDTTVRPTRAFIGILDLRADGTASWQQKVFLEEGGAPQTSEVLEGEWTVEPNCFGFIDFPEHTAPPPHSMTVEIDYQFVAVGNATELFFITNNILEEGDAKLLFRR